MTSADLHTLTGAFALHALSDRESEEFARHLSACEACDQEVRELQETAARLALAAAVTPSAEFRARVMAALPEVRQLPPLVENAGGRSFWPLRRRLIQRRLPQLALAACLVLALVAGGFAIDAHQQEQRQRQATAQAQSQAAALSALFSAPDASFHGAAVKGGGSSTVVSSQLLQQTAFVFQGLAELPSGKVYELWYSKGGHMVPAGLLPERAVDGATMLTGTPSGAAGVGVTVEPAGGSPQPTTTPVVLVGLPTT
ncbi:MULTISPECIES: anti-sigma factor domain-containing protein [Streptacidiphilus]|uniref:Regulator of SigK n=1 Tax=Streptacidiphilus cavernicola TaxID=3342716 RepID=A0ABV6UTP1_9ACTN|nr:anti-sigma factor [Streptacidiphilus jeojiense]